jgi:hypothetical protein
MPGIFDAMGSHAMGRCFGPPSPTAAFGDLIQISRQGVHTLRPVEPLAGPNPAESSPNQPGFAVRSATKTPKHRIFAGKTTSTHPIAVLLHTREVAGSKPAASMCRSAAALAQR